ncbi:unnamed protein product [Leptosia nina]|uniref:Uncharacterized protein n=1 Tax=Leptosia nina TaxID=320188 RepID=A0AAV1JL83_9NEOP
MRLRIARRCKRHYVTPWHSSRPPPALGVMYQTTSTTGNVYHCWRMGIHLSDLTRVWHRIQNTAEGLFDNV